jgi:hypothetical protein
MSAHTGQIVATSPRVSGADEAWYDCGSDRFYLAITLSRRTVGCQVMFGQSWTVLSSPHVRARRMPPLARRLPSGRILRRRRHDEAG